MTEKIVNIITYKIYKQNIISHCDLRKMNYAMLTLLNELIKTIILFVYFLAIQRFDLFLFSYLILVSIRSISGGLHLDTNLKCFIVSFIFFNITVLSAPFLTNIPTYFEYIIIFSSILIIYWFSPMPSLHRPIKDKNIIHKSKYISTIITIIWVSIFYLIIEEPVFFSIGLLTILLQGTQLLIGRRHSHGRM
ncbi:accessory gene regulator B [Natranaerovirga hydrolytica]|uniref:Accessory gene regulator B n=1 Tax=Natranaerovirga hydrolytica TaxID=680378 RepID=A0A4V2Q1R0_9FIRM|nr:accessory gene regulator B family protein [Natranaerovirga hydrolytica]TCK98571.1 accessory gene regulator B [Natranaerovirga hydrolytica]